jgi:NADPH:quinone reductase-like Zn-dependent oxidoreductase
MSRQQHSSEFEEIYWGVKALKGWSVKAEKYLPRESPVHNFMFSMNQTKHSGKKVISHGLPRPCAKAAKRSCSVSELRKGWRFSIWSGAPILAELAKRGIRGAAIWVHPDAKDLAEIAHLIDESKIEPIATQVLPLSEAIPAERQAETHHTRGKIVLRIADEPKG